MDGGAYASIVAAVVAALSAWAVARSAANGNRVTKEMEAKAALESQRIEAESAKESTRSAAESEAYERARAFDVATIERQEAELLRLRSENQHLHIDNRRLNGDLNDVNSERDALRNEIRVMHDDRHAEREECRKIRIKLAALEGKPTPTEAELNYGYSEPGDSFPSD